MINMSQSDANIANPKNEALIKEILDGMVNDSENLERTLTWFTDDCVWVMEPGGTEYHGLDQIKTFAGIAMSLRGHDKGEHRTKIINCFAAGENICIEYSHGMVSTETFTGLIVTGSKGGIPTGVLRYCMAYHTRDGKVDRVHEYINSSSWWQNFLLPIGMGYLHWATIRKLAKNAYNQ